MVLFTLTMLALEIGIWATKTTVVSTYRTLRWGIGKLMAAQQGNSATIPLPPLGTRIKRRYSV